LSKKFQKNRTKKTSPQEPSQDLPLLTRKTLLLPQKSLANPDSAATPRQELAKKLAGIPARRNSSKNLA
jgi:hypothetical protein